MYQKLEQKVILSGTSQATLKGYGRSIAHISLFFNTIPLELSDAVINEYLAEIRSSKNPSETYFKHAVYGLRYVFRLFGREDKAIALPQIERSKKLPVILNRKETLELLSTPKLLKHRVLLGLTYAAGLRLFEVAALRTSDIDFERQTVFVEQGRKTAPCSLFNPKNRHYALKPTKAYLLIDFLFLMTHQILFALSNSSQEIAKAFPKPAFRSTACYIEGGARGAVV